MNAGDWIRLLQQQAAATSAWEWIAVLTGVAEVLLARANKVWLYPTGIISVSITIVLYLQGELYAESLLNVYYLVMSVYGWAHWVKRGDGPPLPVSRATGQEWLVTAAIVILGWAGMWYVLDVYTGSDVPSWDALVAATGWAGMWLLARRKVENWLVLNVSNIFAVPLLYKKGYFLYSGLSVFLFIVAIFGYIEWKRLYREQRAAALLR